MTDRSINPDHLDQSGEKVFFDTDTGSGGSSPLSSAKAGLLGGTSETVVQSNVSFEADLTPQGTTNETLVNTTTGNTQRHPSMAVLDDGTYVVVWESENQDGSGFGIYAQIFNADGTAQGSEFQVNTTTVGDQRYPAVTNTENGGFAIVWSSSNQDGSGLGVFGRLFEADGTAVGGEFRVNTEIASSQDNPSITTLADGGFVVTWESNGQDGSGFGIYGQRYGSDGVAVGSEFRVNTTTASQQFYSHVTALSDGGFVVVFQTDNGGTFDILVQRFDAAGAAVGGEIVANTTTSGNQATASVAELQGGGFVVIWETGGGTSDTEIIGQIFDSQGQRVGGEFQVNTFTTGFQENPTVISLDDGGFLVTWASLSQDGSDWGMYAQRYDASGNTVGDEFLVNQTTTGSQFINFLPRTPAAQLDDGNVVILWEGTGPGDSFGINSRTFSLPENPTPFPTNGEFLVNTATAPTQFQPVVRAFEDGGYIAVWVSDGQDGNGNGVFAQRFDANGDPIGGEFQVNTATISAQREPSVAVFADGSFVIAWSSLNQDGSSWGIYAQRYDESGNPVGGEFRVNTFTSQTQNEASVASLADDGFVITWTSTNQDGSGRGIYAQRYDANGLAVGGEFRVNTTTFDNQEESFVLGLSDGGFLVTWGSRSQDGSGFGIYAQRYNASGNAVGGEFLVNTVTSADQRFPSAVELDGGGFVIAWSSINQDGSGWGIFAQRYDANGNAVGSEFQVNTFTTNSQLYPSLTSLSEGGFLVTWSSDIQEAGGAGVYGQRFDADGNAIGDEFRINETTQGTQFQDFRSLQGVDELADGSIVSIWRGNGEGDTAGIFTRIFEVPQNTPPVDPTPAPADGEFLVNTTVANSQIGANVAVLDDGGFVVSWSSLNQDGSNWGVFAQRFDENGVAQGAEFQVNTFTNGTQLWSAIAALSDGGFVITWYSQGQDGSGAGIYGQRYAADGTPQGSEFLINTTTTNNQIYQSVTAFDDGGFVVTWESSGQDGVQEGIYGQRFDANGAALGSEFLVNTTTNLRQIQSFVETLADGGFLVLWNSVDQDGSLGGIYGQRFDANGAAQGIEFQVNTTTANTQEFASAATLADGGFVVTWSSFNQDGSGWGIYGQRYDANGVAQGTEFQINTETSDSQIYSSITALSDGGFLVIWASDGQDGSNWGTYGQRFDADGNPLGDEFLINETTLGPQQQGFRSLQAVEEMADGSIVAVWHGNGVGDNPGVFARIFDVPGNAPPANAAPEGTDNTVTIDEDATYTFEASDFGFTDADAGDALASVRITTLPADGVLALDGTPVTADQVIDAADIGDLTFTPDQDGNGAAYASFTFQVSDGVDEDASPNTFTFDVTALNDAPVLDLNGAGEAGFDITVPYTEQEGPIAVAPDGLISDVDSPTITGLLNIGITDGEGLLQFASTGDGAGEVRIDGTDAYYEGVLVGTVNGGGAGGLVLFFNANGTPEAAQALLRALTYENTSDTPDATATISILFSDGGTAPDGGQSVAREFATIEITAVDDPSTVEINPAGPLVPQGSEVLVNTTTTGGQTSASVAQLEGGGFIVTWVDFGRNSGDTNGSAIRAQLFGADGAPVGGEFLVNTNTSGNQLDPEAIALSDGAFVIFWNDGSNGGTVRGQIYEADGTTRGSEFTVTTQSFDAQDSVTALDDGGFVVTFRAASNGFDVFARIFDSDGNQVGGAFRVNSSVSGLQEGPNVTALIGGGFVVSWEDRNTTGGDVRAQIYQSDGTAVGGEISVNTLTADRQSGAIVEPLANGDFVIVWTDANQTSIRARVYGADGTPVTGELTVNSTNPGVQLDPVVVHLPSGGFVVAWQDNGQNGGDISFGAIRAQVYAADGTRVGGEFLVNTTTAREQENPAIAALDGGGFVIGWQDNSRSGDDNDGRAIRAQVFADDGTPVGSEQLVNSSTESDQLNVVLTGLFGGDFVAVWDDFAGSAEVRLQLFGPQLVATEQVALDLKGQIDVDDADNPASVEVVLSVTTGVLDVTAGGSGATVNGSGTNEVTITGTLAQVQALLGSDATSTVTYTADSDSPPSTDDLSVTIIDVTNSGAEVEAVETITINAVNDLPEGTDNTITIDEDGSHTFEASDFGFSDVDGDTLQTVRIDSLTLDEDATLELDGVAVTAGDEIAVGDLGDLVFTPGADENGEDYSSFTFSVGDGTAFSASSNTMTFDVDAVNDAPTGTDNTVVATETANSFAPVTLVFENGLNGYSGTQDIWINANSPNNTTNHQNFLLLDANGPTQVLIGFNDIFGLTPDLIGLADTDQIVSAFLEFSVFDRGFQFSLWEMDRFWDEDSTWNSLDNGVSGDEIGDLLATEFSIPIGDYSFDVTSAVLNWQNGAPNFGFLLQTASGDWIQINSSRTASPPSLVVNLQREMAGENASYTFSAADFGFNDVDADNNDPAASGEFGAVRIDNLPDAGEGVLMLNGEAVTEGQVIPVSELGSLIFVGTDRSEDSTVSFTFTVRDNSGDAGSEFATSSNTMTVTIDNLNDEPDGTDNTITIDEDTSHTFAASDFGFVDADIDDSLQSVRITSLPADGVLELSGNPVAEDDVIAVGDIGNLVFTPDADGNGTGYASFTFQVSDGEAEDSSPNTLTIDVTAVNDPPAGTDNIVETDEDTPYVFSAGDFGFSDVDAGDSLQSVRITNVSGPGSLTLSGNPVFDGDVIAVADIGNLVFTPDENESGINYASFDFQVSDGTIEDASPNNLIIDVAAVNDPSTVDIADDLEATEQIALDLFGEIEVGDVDNPASVSVVLSVVTGELTVTAGGSGANVSGSGTDEVTITGSLAQVRALLGSDATSTVTYIADTNTPPASDDLTVTITDLTNSGAPVSETETISIIDVDDSGELSISDASVTEGNSGVTELTFTVTRTDGTDGEVSVDYDVAATTGNTVNASDFVGGVFPSGTVTFADGESSQTITIEISTDTIQETDERFEITLSNPLGGATIGTASAIGTIINDDFDSLVDLADDLAATEQVALDLKGEISVSDGNNPASVTVVLSVVSGILNVTAGGSGANVSGSGTDEVTITGSLAEVQALLGSDATSVVEYVADDDSPPASDDLTVSFTDESSGTDAVEDTETIAITAVNDVPDGTDNTIEIDEDSSHTFSAGDFGFTDPDTGDTLAAVRITTVPSNGELLLLGAEVTAGQVINVGDLGNLVFIPGENENGDSYASFTFQVADRAAEDPTPNTITFDVTAVDDPSSADVAEGLEAVEQVALDLTGQIVVDDDDNPASVRVVLGVATGVLTVTSSTTDVTIVGSGSNEVTLTGSLAAVQALLDGTTATELSYIADSETPPPSDDLTVTITDLTNGGAPVSDTETIPITAVLTGGGSNDSLIGTGADEIIVGNSGNDVMRGNGGDDVLEAGSGNDEARGGSGNDIINGGSGDDRLRGNGGADRLDGGSGDDLLIGGGGADVLLGSTGQDELRGGGGADDLDGGTGNDLLLGGNGNDTLNGSTGDDILEGGAGRDTLTGGTGQDTFVIDAAGGAGSADTIADFTILDRVLVSNADGVAIEIRQAGANTEILAGGVVIATLVGAPLFFVLDRVDYEGTPGSINGTPPAAMQREIKVAADSVIEEANVLEPTVEPMAASSGEEAAIFAALTGSGAGAGSMPSPAESALLAGSQVMTNVIDELVADNPLDLSLGDVLGFGSAAMDDYEAMAIVQNVGPGAGDLTSPDDASLHIFGLEEGLAEALLVPSLGDPQSLLTENTAEFFG